MDGLLFFFILDLFTYFRETEQERAWKQASGGGAKGENSQADPPTPAPRLHPTTLRSWPEPKSRVRCLTGYATQGPLHHLLNCFSRFIFSSKLLWLSQTFFSIFGIWFLALSKLRIRSVIVFGVSLFFHIFFFCISIILLPQYRTSFIEFIPSCSSSLSWKTPGGFLLFLRLCLLPDWVLCYFHATCCAFSLLRICIATCHFFSSCTCEWWYPSAQIFHLLCYHMDKFPLIFSTWSDTHLSSPLSHNP